MDLLVGILLVLVFLAFALAMFLERISALLALPLMAASFLLISVGADLLQPGEVGGASVPAAKTDEADQSRLNAAAPSRFAQWKATRRTQARLLHEKSAVLTEAVERVRSALDADEDEWAAATLAALDNARQLQRAFEAHAGDAIGAMYTPFHRPSSYGGSRAHFEEALGQILVANLLEPIREQIATLPPQAARRAAMETVEDAAKSAREAHAAHPPPPAEDTSAFTVRCAVSYVVHYVILLFRAGSLELATAIIATIFGGMFALYVKNLKIAEWMVYWTAEYAGGSPFWVTLAIFGVTAVIFTSVGGLGTVIMLGAIILPILRSIGLSSIAAAGVYLIAISLGGTLQPVARRLWIEYYGVSPRVLDSILWTMAAIYSVVGVIWIFLGTRRRMLSSFCATPRPRDEQRSLVPARLMVAPLIPIALVYFGGVEEITAFTAAIVYMFVCVCRRAGASRLLARSLIEGAQTVMPPVLLMLGIGLLLVSLTTDAVQGYLRPLLTAVTPATRTGYIAGFALLAPLALYRGPLNVWGMGLAVSGILLTTSPLAPAAILCAILAVNMLQGVCDPTNTANVWIAGYLGISANRILRGTIVLVWLAAIVAITVFGLRFVPAA